MPALQLLQTRGDLDKQAGPISDVALSLARKLRSTVGKGGKAAEAGSPLLRAAAKAEKVKKPALTVVQDSAHELDLRKKMETIRKAREKATRRERFERALKGLPDHNPSTGSVAQLAADRRRAIAMQHAERAAQKTPNKRIVVREGNPTKSKGDGGLAEALKRRATDKGLSPHARDTAAVSTKRLKHNVHVRNAQGQTIADLWAPRSQGGKFMREQGRQDYKKMVDYQRYLKDNGYHAGNIPPRFRVGEQNKPLYLGRMKSNATLPPPRKTSGESVSYWKRG